MTPANDPYFFLRESLRLSNESSRTRVTLTFAQSVDAKIAGKAGKQIRLSCDESMLMTHWMRSMHDAILIGIGTALNDNPQLNTRLLPSNERHNSPLPIILDRGLRFQANSKLLNNWREGKGRQPVIFTQPADGSDELRKERRKTLEQNGAVIKEVSVENGQLSLSATMEALWNMGIKTLMVEGGATVIESFINSAHVDSLVITISPTVVGAAGVGYNCDGEQVTASEHVITKLVGVDSVVVWRRGD